MFSSNEMQHGEITAPKVLLTQQKVRKTSIVTNSQHQMSPLFSFIQTWEIDFAAKPTTTWDTRYD
jgi:hypothetical protein